MVYEDFSEEMERMWRKMQKMMRRMTEMTEKPEFYRERLGRRKLPVDIREKDDEILLEADMPGFDKEDIDIRVIGNRVDISAQREEEKREERENLYRMERRAGKVRRSLTLPSQIDPETVSAELDRGVLKIRMKKKEKEKGRKVEVK